MAARFTTAAALIFSGVGLTLFATGCSRGEIQARSRIPLVDCEVPGHRGTAKCGTYLVWENRQAQSGRQIALNLVILPASGRLADADPVFYFDGGPGAAASRAAATIGRFLRAVNESRDLVFIDARGTGRANPLNCPEPPADAPLQAFFDDFLAEAYVRACLAAQTADVRFYTQVFTADDVNEVREALGYRRINLYGSSGGTRQQQLYMRRHGASVRSVVMHGVQAMDGEMPLPFSRALDHGIAGLLDACEKTAGCRDRYPALREDWNALRRQFELLGVVEASVRDQRTGRTERLRVTRGVLADGLRHMLYTMRTAWEVPEVIHRAALGDFNPFVERELRQVTRFADALSHGMFITATCAEDVRFIEEKDIDRATAGTFLGDYRVRRQQAACRIWPAGEGIDADFQRPVATEVPVLLISGEFDVATPPSEAERVVKSLPNGRHIVFPNQGHDYSSPGCAAKLIADFLETADPGSLDTACVGATKRPGFDTR
jgi:pimeloyl-ACP methyl ester carboxylesterase